MTRQPRPHGAEREASGLVKPTVLGRFFGVGSKTIHTWVDRYGFPAQRTLGGHLRHDPIAVVRWLEERQREVPAGLAALVGQAKAA